VNPSEKHARTSTVPLPEPVAGALERHSGLADLSRRLACSRSMLADALSALPTGLRSEVRAGPLDDEGWSVLASNAAVAAKLRHVVPQIQAALREHGWPETTIRVRIHQP
jgi:hypothetical protein